MTKHVPSIDPVEDLSTGKVSTMESRQKADSGLELVEALSQDIIREFAPEEIDLFDEVFTTYVENPAAFESGNGAESPLAFGAGELAGFVSPVVIAIVIEALQYLAQEAFTTLKTESADAIKAKISALFQRQAAASDGAPDAPAVEPLSPQQLTQVRKLARAQAVRHGMETAEANKLADALVGRLVLATA